MTPFDQAFAVVVGIEAGYVNDPRDPGGETKYGISKRWHPNVDIANLTLPDAKAIYKREYWDLINGDALPPPLALLAFDAAVHCGPGRARQWTAQARLYGGADGAGQCTELMARRMVYEASLPTWRIYALGWARRMAQLPFRAVLMTES